MIFSDLDDTSINITILVFRFSPQRKELNPKVG
jgi:hypothetical protein